MFSWNLDTCSYIFHSLLRNLPMKNEVRRVNRLDSWIFSPKSLKIDFYDDLSSYSEQCQINWCGVPWSYYFYFFQLSGILSILCLEWIISMSVRHSSTIVSPFLSSYILWTGRVRWSAEQNSWKFSVISASGIHIFYELISLVSKLLTFLEIIYPFYCSILSLSFAKNQSCYVNIQFLTSQVMIVLPAFSWSSQQC